MTTARVTSPDWLQERVRQNVRLLKSVRSVSDQEIADKGGFSSRQVISHRLSGRTDITSEDMARLAAGLRVEPHVLLLRTDEALRWTEDNAGFKPPKYRKQPKMTSKARR